MSDLEIEIPMKMDCNNLENIDESIDDQNNKYYLINQKSDNLKSKKMLGSVSTITCPGTRTSARVIQKMKQETRSISPPPNEKKDSTRDERIIQKTSNQSKAPKVIWTNNEKNLFFDALNEFGKEFDAIANFINSKIKRKTSGDQSFKSKEQIRQLYYQTFHKISKYLRFSEDVKKPVQELYALINYGEIRRKLVFVSEKNCMKIKDLVYKGCVIVRSKGKNIRIKTPSCKALRKLNQLQDWQEDIKLPSKIEINLRPATMEAWGRVQNIAQNPIIQTTVPLQKKLINLIKTFQYKWRNQDMKLHEQAMKLVSNTIIPSKNESKPLDSDTILTNEPLICFMPPPNTTIYRPMLNLTEYLSNVSICLNSYEKKIGAKIRGETLCQDRYTNKRPRSDSGCEKLSPENKKFKNFFDSGDSASEKNDKDDKLNDSNENLNLDDLSDDIRDILSDDDFYKFTRQNSNEIDNIQNDLLTNSFDCFISLTKDNNSDTKPYSDLRTRKKDIKCNNNNNNNNNNINVNKRREYKRVATNLRPLVNDDVINKIRSGWTILNAGDITIGDIYVMFGQNSKIILEYKWNNCDDENTLRKDKSSVPYSTSNIDENYANKIQSSSLANKLRHLLIIASLSERMKKKQCNCGHICDKNFKTKKTDGEIITKSYISNKIYTSSNTDYGVFRQPTTPFRRTVQATENLRSTSNGSRLKQSPRTLKGRTVSSKQVVVQRHLPVRPDVTQSFDVVNSVQLQQLPNEEIDENNINDTQTESIQENLEDDDDGGSIEENGDEQQQQQPVQIEELTETVQSTIDIEETIVNEDASPIITSDIRISSTADILENDTNDDDPGLKQLMEISLPSPLPINSIIETTDTYNDIPPMSPMRILREPIADEKWLEDNINDFSLSSFLGHLDEINREDVTQDNTNISIISETSVDYMTKFAEIAASMQNDGKDL